MKNLKKLFALMMALGLVTFGNVYAEEIAVVDDVEVTEEGAIVDEDGTALAGDGSFTITDDALLNIAGGLTDEAEVEDETVDYRDMDIALEEEPRITEEEDNLLTILAGVTVGVITVVALIIILVVRNKKKKALAK